jgi:hypothetical protein
MMLIIFTNFTLSCFKNYFVHLFIKLNLFFMMLIMNPYDVNYIYIFHVIFFLKLFCPLILCVSLVTYYLDKFK